MRIIAVDFGDARTGVAISDPDGLIAGRALTINERDPMLAARAVCEEAESCGAERIVLGYPKNMDGSIGPRALKCEEFKAMLEEMSGLEVVLWDERRTTVDAHRILSANGKRLKKHKKTVDAVAASLILEGYLASLR